MLNMPEGFRAPAGAAPESAAPAATEALNQSSVFTREALVSQADLREAGRAMRGMGDIQQLEGNLNDAMLAGASQSERMVYEIRRFENTNPQEVTRIFERTIENGWSAVTTTDENNLSRTVRNTREAFAEMVRGSEQVQLSPETTLRAAELLAMPIIGVENTPGDYRAASRFLDMHGQTILDNFYNQPSEQLRMNNLQDALQRDSLLTRYSNADLVGSPDARCEFIARVIDIARAHHGLTSPRIDYFSDALELAKGNVNIREHAVSINLENQKWEGETLRESLIHTGVHEVRHLFQNVLILTKYPFAADTFEDRLTTPLDLNKPGQLMRDLLFISGTLMHHEQLARAGAIGDDGNQPYRTQDAAYRSQFDERDAERAAHSTRPNL